MFVSAVQPVAMRSAVFCIVCSLLICVCDTIGDHIVLAYSMIGLVIVLYVASIVSFCFPQCVPVSALRMLSVCLALFVVCLMCSPNVCFVSSVRPRIFEWFVVCSCVLLM